MSRLQQRLCFRQNLQHYQQRFSQTLATQRQPSRQPQCPSVSMQQLRRPNLSLQQLLCRSPSLPGNVSGRGRKKKKHTSPPKKNSRTRVIRAWAGECSQVFSLAAVKKMRAAAAQRKTKKKNTLRLTTPRPTMRVHILQTKTLTPNTKNPKMAVQARNAAQNLTCQTHSGIGSARGPSSGITKQHKDVILLFVNVLWHAALFLPPCDECWYRNNAVYHDYITRTTALEPNHFPFLFWFPGESSRCVSAWP